LDRCYPILDPNIISVTPRR